MFGMGDQQRHAALSAQRNATPALSTGQALFQADGPDVLLVLRYITDGRDVFGLPAENGVYLCVVNRSETERSYSVDCSAAGLGVVTGVAPPVSGEIVRLK